MLLLLLSSSSLSSEGGRFGITGVAVGVALRGDVLLEVFGVNKRFKPEGPAWTVVDGGDVMGVGEESTPTPSGAVDPNMFYHALLGENLFASSSWRSFPCMK